ncbi:MAG: hypothetical protein QOJ64_3638 [Acidobacteriota bacterium]|jgi:hypothetical protein|nr:hypothetical protein [Acidobacteriota bacterium]
MAPTDFAVRAATLSSTHTTPGKLADHFNEAHLVKRQRLVR